MAGLWPREDPPRWLARSACAIAACAFDFAILTNFRRKFKIQFSKKECASISPIFIDARTRPYSLQHRKDEGKRKRYWLVLMIVMLCVYIGALQKSDIVVCQKQFRAFVVGKLGRNYKNFNHCLGPIDARSPYNSLSTCIRQPRAKIGSRPQVVLETFT